MPKKTADQIIRNTYRTLLTRGQKGCFIYCTDKELENYLRDRLSKVKEHATERMNVSQVAEDRSKY